MSSLVAAATLGSLGIAVMWTDDLIADRLATQRVVRRCHYYAACAAILIAVAVGFVWLAGPNIGSGIWLANSALPGWKAWKHRNDDDRNDRLRRLWAKAKTSLPKPRLVPVRAIAVPT